MIYKMWLPETGFYVFGFCGLLSEEKTTFHFRTILLGDFWQRYAQCFNLCTSSHSHPSPLCTSSHSHPPHGHTPRAHGIIFNPPSAIKMMLSSSHTHAHPPCTHMHTPPPHLSNPHSEAPATQEAKTRECQGDVCPIQPDKKTD